MTPVRRRAIPRRYALSSDLEGYASGCTIEGRPEKKDGCLDEAAMALRYDEAEDAWGYQRMLRISIEYIRAIDCEVCAKRLT